MKKLVLLVIVSLIISSCKSKEEKAQEIIKEEMFKTLYDFDSYEPIETKVDSSFYSIYTDTAILKYGYIISEMQKEREENLDKVESAISNMKIWSGSYSSLGRNEFTKAKAEGEKFMDRANTNLKMIIIASDSIKKLSANTKNEFNGWKVTHKFRAKTKGGNSTIGNYIYIMDKDMKNIIYQEDTEDKDIINAKKYIKEAISK